MRLKTIVASLIAMVVLAACGGGAAPASDEPQPLTIGLLPVLDSLPYYIAQQEGYFAEEGVEVSVAEVASPVERDQLMQAGEIDGMLNELSTTAVFNRDSVQIQSVILARQPVADGPVFRLLAAPGSDITAPGDLAGVPVAVSQNTIIEYVTQRLLEEEGVSTDQIETQSVPVIPERFQLLLEGDIQAATLPDPLAQAAVQAGAVNVIDDSAYPFYTATVLSFSTETLETNAAGVRAFLRAWDRAVADLNASPEDYRALFIEEVNVPPTVEDTYDIPPFPRSELPTEEQWQDVIAWLTEKGLLDEPVDFSASVTGDYLE